MPRIADSRRYIGSRIGSMAGTSAAWEDRNGVVGGVVTVGCWGGVQSACNIVCT